MLNTPELIQRAIDKIGDNYPSKPIVWKSASHPLGHTSFLRLVPESFKPVKSQYSALIKGWSIDVWLNDCGCTYKDTWHFDYFDCAIENNRKMNVIKQIALS